MSSDKYALLESELNTLVGAPCWAVLVSGGLDNRVTLSFGDQLPRSTPLLADTLTKAQQQFAGAYELSIADCTWRLDSPDEIVTSWSDDTAARRHWLGYLVGQRITAWEITWPGLDLTLHAANSLTLRLFCDQTNPDDSSDNYTLHTPQRVFLVGVRSHLDVQPRHL